MSDSAMPLATITIQSRLPGPYGRKDKTEFAPFEISDHDYRNLKVRINESLRQFPSAGIDDSYLDPTTIVIEFSRGYTTAEQIANSCEDILDQFFCNTVRL